MPELVLKAEVYEIIGAAMEVYYHLGRGFLEPVYQEALELEMKRRHIPFQHQYELTINYKGNALDKKYIADLLCYDQVLVELKVLECLGAREQAQILNYMKATQKRVGLLINFGCAVRLEWRRYVL